MFGRRRPAFFLKSAEVGPDPSKFRARIFAALPPASVEVQQHQDRQGHPRRRVRPRRPLGHVVQGRAGLSRGVAEEGPRTSSCVNSWDARDEVSFIRPRTRRDRQRDMGLQVTKGGAILESNQAHKVWALRVYAWIP